MFSVRRVAPLAVLAALLLAGCNKNPDPTQPDPRAVEEEARKAAEKAARETAANNLKQMAIAIRNYHDAADKLPPLTGTPAGNWAMYILPYIEQQNLYTAEAAKSNVVPSGVVKTYLCPSNGAGWDQTAPSSVAEGVRKTLTGSK